MKQFQYSTKAGRVAGPFHLEEIERRFPLSVRTVAQLNVGESALDADGDKWLRLQDVAGPYGTPLADALHAALSTDAQAERRERIALAVLPTLLNVVLTNPELAVAHSESAKAKGLTFEQYLSQDAVALSDALIAKLDGAE